MSDNFWIVELAIKPGKLDSFKVLVNEMVETIQASEPGTMSYELFISEDEKTCHIYEQYVDAAAVGAHLDNFGQTFAERLAAAIEVTSFTVYGTPSDAVKEALRDFGVAYMAPLGGFAR
jgi:quinol monooxygenase YgiN